MQLMNRLRRQKRQLLSLKWIQQDVDQRLRRSVAVRELGLTDLMRRVTG